MITVERFLEFSRMELMLELMEDRVCMDTSPTLLRMVLE
jgi:hypothetical protein